MPPWWILILLFITLKLFLFLSRFAFTNSTMMMQPSCHFTKEVKSLKPIHLLILIFWNPVCTCKQPAWNEVTLCQQVTFGLQLSSWWLSQTRCSFYMSTDCYDHGLVLDLISNQPKLTLTAPQGASGIRWGNLSGHEESGVFRFKVKLQWSSTFVLILLPLTVFYVCWQNSFVKCNKSSFM